MDVLKNGYCVDVRIGGLHVIANVAVHIKFGPLCGCPYYS